MSTNRQTVNLRRSRAVPVRGGESLSQVAGHRTCAAQGCLTVLSRYNPADSCSRHAGWQDAPTRRQRG